MAKAAKTATIKKATIKRSPAKKPTIKTVPKAPAAGSGDIDRLWSVYWQKPGDEQLLRVYADALEQAGDPRGTFIQLSLLEQRTPEQDAARERLLNKNKGDLVGPAKAYLREIEFGANGLVAMVRTEADKVIAGAAELSRLNPRLILTITSMKTEALAKAFAKLDLGNIYFIDFGWLTGTHGGCRLTDKLLLALAPGLANVENLELSFSTAANSPTPAGMRALGGQLRKLRFLAMDYPPGSDLPSAQAYAAAMRDAYPTLKAIECPSMLASDFPNVMVNKLIGGDEDINGILREDTATKVERLFS